jgi:hypothetical protein
MRSLAVFLSMFALLLGACATQYQKRGLELPLKNRISLDIFEASEKSQLDLEARSVEHFTSPEFMVGVVEMNDEGLLNRQQYEQVLEAVRTELNDAQRGSLLVVFAHGWHHGCRTCDRDLACFRRVLNELSRDEQAPDGRGRRVVGVYLGWRGRALLGEPDVLTIWNRKRAAEHIGRTAGREVLGDLHELWLDHREDLGKRVTMVTIGHSLGGALVFSAVKQNLSGNVDDIVNKGRERTYRVVRTQGERSLAPEGRKALRSRFGDLVVLVNPAIEASEYQPFDDDLPDLRHKQADREQLRKRELPLDKNDDYSDDQLPILVTVASTADTAVGWIFPFSRWLSALNVIRNGEVFIRSNERIGMGRYSPHVTHTLKYFGPELPGSKVEDRQVEEAKKAGKSCLCTKTWESESFDFRKTQLDLQMEAMSLASESAGQGDPGQEKALMTLNLVDSRAKSRGWDLNSPYFVITTDESVIRAHSDIFNPVFTGFLRKFIAAFERSKEEKATTAY